MKKLCLFLAFLLLFLNLVSCSSGLEAAPTETKAEETATKQADQKKTEDETEEKSIMQKSDPAQDDVINVLMIGNSFCNGYVEELYGIAKAAGVNMKVCNLYYPGCTLSQHWTWWKLNEKRYQYFETDANGRRKVLDPTNLKTCLAQENWDVISFQQGSSQVRTTVEDAKDKAYKYLTDLLNYANEQFPQSTFYWQQTWAYQVGYDRSGFVVDTVEKQTAMANLLHEFSIGLCKDFNLSRIPSGDAWHYARQDTRVGDVLCNRGEGGDNYHEGTTGGGQYLNACVWFETITGQSCIGNTWRPDDYSLSEEMIPALQEAAHRAVAESRG